MSNPRNSGTLTGRLAGDPQVFNNQDGSKKVRFTLMVDRNFVNKATNERDSDAIDVEAFVNKATSGTGPYALVHRGDLVQVQTTLRKDVYTRKDGSTAYDLKVIAEEITYLEPKSVTQARMAKRVQDAEAQNRALQTQAPAQAPAPAQAAVAAQASPVVNDEQLPFG